MQGVFAAAFVTAVAGALVAADLTDPGFRRWWAERALTTDVVAGLLVLLITLLVVDQLVRQRQFNDRSHAVAAQVAILMAQASNASESISSALDGSGDPAAASDAVRTYMMMLLVVAPILIEDPRSRGLLEQAQLLGGEMVRVQRALAQTHDPTAISHSRLDDAAAQLRAAATPLLQPIDIKEFFAPDPAPPEAPSRSDPLG